MPLDHERVELRHLMSGNQAESNEVEGNVKDEDVLMESKQFRRVLAASFFLFGLVNNVLYVIILSAALDLVASVPKGVVLFCNIAPSLTAKVAWPYLLRGEIRYARRIIGCCTLSFLGMLIIGLVDSLFMRLLGICCASFSCGLGEITFLQLLTRYKPRSVSNHCVGYFASGTGAAGLVGAGLWWLLRRIGVRTGILICSCLPFALPLVWFMLLARPDSPRAIKHAEQHPDTDDSEVAYSSIPIADEEPLDEAEPTYTPSVNPGSSSLSLADKWMIVSPLLIRYMLPLFAVYLFEYIINQGVSPTLLYPVPDSGSSTLFSHLIKQLSDYYPLWQLVYQTFVFLSRSSISFGLPPLPIKLLSLPAILQGIILTVLTVEAAEDIFKDYGPYAVFLLISIEGICGGLAYVNVYYHIGHEEIPLPVAAPEGSEDSLLRGSNVKQLEKWKGQAKEFRIGSLGFADSFGILLASLIAMPTELELCKHQVLRGKDLCRRL